jgi:hypothetical protein
MYTIHHNEAYFPEPFAFKLERWLDSDGSAQSLAERRTLRETFSAFGVGPRACAGKAMAYMEASLVLAKTMWYFDFQRPLGSFIEGVGGGMKEDRTGRGRVGEFQLYDQFIADHEGPWLMFKAREGLCADLE